MNDNNDKMKTVNIIVYKRNIIFKQIQTLKIGTKGL